jgi:hypothetical protein
MSLLYVFDKLKQKSDFKASICEIFGFIPKHTLRSSFGSTLYGLWKNNYIILYDCNMCEINLDSFIDDEDDVYKMKAGYKIGNYFEGKEHNTYIMLTNKIFEVQETLGISISKIIKLEEDEVKNSKLILVDPLFKDKNIDNGTEVFVLMPFSEALFPVFNDHIKKVCKKFHLVCKRADDIFSTSEIMGDIWTLIRKAKIIIADCTNKNPNVFYELGIAHTLGKPVILITQNAEDVPFDIRHLRYIKYEYTPVGMKKFEYNLGKVIQDELIIPHHISST